MFLSYHNTEDLDLNLHCHENLKSCELSSLPAPTCCHYCIGFYLNILFWFSFLLIHMQLSCCSESNISFLSNKYSVFSIKFLSVVLPPSCASSFIYLFSYYILSKKSRAIVQLQEFKSQ